jgi:hypothetical protein
VELLITVPSDSIQWFWNHDIIRACHEAVENSLIPATSSSSHKANIRLLKKWIFIGKYVTISLMFIRKGIE